MRGMDASRVRVKCRDRYGEANILSKLFWFWLEPLFIIGCRKRHLDHEDLYDAPAYAKSHTLQEKLERYWNQELRRRYQGRRPRLWAAFLKLIVPKLAIFGILSVFEMFVLLAQAILVGLLAEYFVGEMTSENTRNAFLYGVGIVICSILSSFLHPHAFIKGQLTGMIARIALTGTIYRKIFNLSLETVGETTIGRIINLASSDVQRIDVGLAYVPYVMLSPIYIIAVLVILWVYLGLGPSALAGVGMMVLLIPVLYFLGKVYANVRFASAKYTDERVKVMNEIISGIRVIKMYGWEHAFKEMISRIRRKESRLILLAGLIRGLLFASKYVILGFALLLMFASFTLSTGQPLTPSIVFTSIVLFNTVKIAVVAYLIQSILGVQESRVALSRIEELLLKDTHKLQLPTTTQSPEGFQGCHMYSSEGNPRKQEDGSTSKQLPCVIVESLAVSWKSIQESNDLCNLTLKDVSFSCDMSNRMLAIVGPVGAGKSTILHSLLGELKPLSGSVEIRGSIGYASQDPWVFSGTVRENILFGEEFEEEWYDEVLEECCLKEDMSLLPFGDLTLVGERGVTLSGGQKARVNLARAVYRKADVYILDDPLSAVDAVVGRRLFQACMSGVLKNSIVVLVTHHLQYAQLADAMLVVDKGESLAYGTYEEVMNMINHSDENERYSRVKDVLSEMIMKTEEVDYVFDVKDLPEDKPVEDTHVVSISDMQGDYSSYTSEVRTSFLGDDVNQEKRSIVHTNSSSPVPVSQQNMPEDPMGVNAPSANTVPLEDKAQGSVSVKTYYRYFKAGGGFIGCFLLLVTFVVGEASISVSEWYLAEWAGANETCTVENATHVLCEFSTEVVILVYFGLVTGSFVLTILRGLLFFYVCIHAAQVLHNRMFAAVLRAPVRFFDTNPIGRIVNRFSKDLHFLDDVLPFFFHDLIALLLRFASFMIVAGIANYYVFIPVVIIVGVFLLVRWYYLTTAREIKRLEAVARSPLFSHITATLQGLTTIRACGRQDASMEYFHAYQDEQTKGWCGYVNASRWLGLRADLISAVFIIAVIFLAIPLASSLDPGLVGLSITYALSLTTLCQYTIKNSTEVESLMISAERLLAYGDLQPEAPLETPPGREKPPSSWPSSGSIKLDKMNFRYSSDTPYVLKDITAHVQSAEKIGIIGRTGAGKSSIIQALFRMAEPEGVLEIDEISITEVGLHDLRQNMSIIPQDPVLFSGSVRYNLDPFSQYSDEEIWRALEQVQLRDTVEEIDYQLQSTVSEGGSNFSVGQRQLMCLGRALLRKNKILVIDEATANVDMTTDAIIQETIRREFSSCTTLTIAHRLHTIMDADRIMVLSGGRVREFDHPHLLMSNPSSLLYHMVEQTGESEAERLKSIAAETYSRRQDLYMW